MYVFLLEMEDTVDGSYKEKIKKVFESHNINKVFIFGAGCVGNMICEVLKGLDIDFDVVDNNQSIQGTSMFDKRVLSPDMLSPEKGALVLVANSGDSASMMEQMAIKGFRANIDVIDFTDWCMYIAYLKYHTIFA